MGLGPVMLDVLGTQLTDDDRVRLLHPLVGGVILFKRNYESPAQLIELTSSIRALRSTPLLIAVDHEGGRVQRFRDGFTRIPPMRELGRIWDRHPQRARHLAQQVGYVLAAELRACGVDFSFTPVLDVDYGQSSVIGDRAFHSDPQAIAELAVSDGSIVYNPRMAMDPALADAMERRFCAYAWPKIYNVTGRRAFFTCRHEKVWATWNFKAGYSGSGNVPKPEAAFDKAGKAPANLDAEPAVTDPTLEIQGLHACDGQAWKIYGEHKGIKRKFEWEWSKTEEIDDFKADGGQPQRWFEGEEKKRPTKKAPESGENEEEEDEGK